MRLVIFFIMLFVPSTALSATWNDVVIAWAAIPQQSGCVTFVTKYQQDNQTGYQLWKRCNASTQASYTTLYISSGGVYEQGSASSIATCDGMGGVSGSAGSEYRWRWGTGGYGAVEYTIKTISCSGGVMSQETQADHPLNYYTTKYLGAFVEPCNVGIQWGNNYHDYSANCAVLDTLMGDFFPVTNNCEYVGLSINAGGAGWVGNVYKSLVPDNGAVNVCNQCVPAGMIPNFGYEAHNTPQPGDEQGRYQCYFVDVVGDPGKPSDSFIPSESGPGSSGSIGGTRAPDVQFESTTTVEYTSGEQTEAHTTVTTTTIRSDGTSSSTKTTTVTNCIDANEDGISDVSGAICGVSTAAVEETDSSLTPPAIPAPDDMTYDTSLPLDDLEVKDWKGLVSDFMSSNPLMTLINGTEITLSNAACSFDCQIFGMQVTFSFCEFESYFNILGAMFLVICALRSIFIALGVD